MKQLIAIALLLYTTAVWANCTTHTIVTDTRTVICTTCCYGTSCTTTCF